MGGEVSKISDHGNGGAAREANPCEEAMTTYMKCVDAKNAESGGLRDGDECEKEAEAYRECRKKAKELKAATTQAATKS